MLVSLSQKLEPLRFSDDILNDLRRQVEEDAREDNFHNIGIDGDDEMQHTTDSYEEEEYEEECNDPSGS